MQGAAQGAHQADAAARLRLGRLDDDRGLGGFLGRCFFGRGFACRGLRTDICERRDCTRGFRRCDSGWRRGRARRRNTLRPSHRRRRRHHRGGGFSRSCNLHRFRRGRRLSRRRRSRRSLRCRDKNAIARDAQQQGRERHRCQSHAAQNFFAIRHCLHDRRQMFACSYLPVAILPETGSKRNSLDGGIPAAYERAADRAGEQVQSTKSPSATHSASRRPEQRRDSQHKPLAATPVVDSIRRVIFDGFHQA